MYALLGVVAVIYGSLLLMLWLCRWSTSVDRFFPPTEKPHEPKDFDDLEKAFQLCEVVVENKGNLPRVGRVDVDLNCLGQGQEEKPFECPFAETETKPSEDRPDFFIGDVRLESERPKFQVGDSDDESD